MNLAEAITRAVRTEDPRHIAGVADYMRFRMGMNWAQSCERVKQATGIEPGEWDALLLEADRYESTH